MIITIDVTLGHSWQDSQEVTYGRLRGTASPTITFSNFDQTQTPSATGQTFVWDQAVGKWKVSNDTTHVVKGTHLGTMGGATSVAAGAKGAVPQPVAGDNTKFLRGDGTWTAIPTTDVNHAVLSKFFI